MSKQAGADRAWLDAAHLSVSRRRPCVQACWAMAGRQTPSLGACVLRSSGAVCRLPSETYAPDQVSSRVRQGRVHPCKTIGRTTDALPRSPVYKFRRLQFLFDSSFASQPQFGSSLFRFFRGSGLQTLPIPLTAPQEQGPKPRWTMALVQRLLAEPCCKGIVLHNWSDVERMGILPQARFCLLLPALLGTLRPHRGTGPRKAIKPSSLSSYCSLTL